MNLPTIILLRHGQTEWNLEGRYQGQLNSNLTDLGKKQAKENALKISHIVKSDVPFKFFSSPLGRAKETTFIICDTLGIDKRQVIFDNNIQEINYGIFEGKTKEFCKNNLSREYAKREAHKWSYRLEGGESYEMASKRVNIWLKSIKDEQLVVLVAHEMINRILRGIYVSLETETMLTLRQPNDMVIKLENMRESIIN